MPLKKLLPSFQVSFFIIIIFYFFITISKLLIHSGHDTTLLPLLAAMQGGSHGWPPYASMMRIELITGKQ